MRSSFYVVAALLAGLGARDAVAAGSHPVVDFASGYLLGDSSGGGGIRAAKPASAKPHYPATHYKVYAWNRYLGTALGTTASPFGPPCEDTLFVKFAPSAKNPKFKNGVVAVAGKWNVLPRVPRQDRAVNQVYKASVATALARAGMKNPDVRVTQVLRVDLEGDGTDEVLITATKNQGVGEKGKGALIHGISPNAHAGEYSLVFLRKIVKGKVRTTLLEGEAYAKDRTFSAPSVFNVGGVFDLNGDGKMEILLMGRYYEGDSTAIYDASGEHVKTVASSGCGA